MKNLLLTGALSCLLVTVCTAQKTTATVKGKPVLQTDKPMLANASAMISLAPPNPADPTCACPAENLNSDNTCNAVQASAFVKIYRADFSYLVAAIDNSALINQLVVRVDKPSISFNLLYLDKKELRAISGGFAAKAGITGDLSTLFSADKWDPAFTFGPRLNIDLYRLLGNGYHRYFFEPDQLEQMKCRINQEKYRLIEREQTIRKMMSAQQRSLDSLLQVGPVEGLKAKLNLAIDSLKTLIEPAKLTVYNTTQLEAVQTTMQWSTKRHLWVSFSPDFSPRTLNIFDAANMAGQQVTEKRQWITTLPITVNYHEVSQFTPAKLLSISWIWERTNDLLNEAYRREYQKEITNYSDSLGTNPKVLYKNTEKKTFYTGNDQVLLNKRINVQYIQFLNLKQTIGLIATFNYVMPDSRSLMNKTYANAGLGVIVPAVTGDGKSKLNIVTTLTINDVAGTVEKWSTERDATYVPKGVGKRLSLIVRVGLPLSFLSGNK